MTKEEYLIIRNDRNQDTMPALYFLYTTKFGTALDYQSFRVFFSQWIFSFHIPLGWANGNAFKKLDIFFSL